VYYIADGATRTIKMYDRDGGYIGLLRDGDPLPVEAPSGLAYGGDHLVVSDSANGRVALVALSDGVQDVIDPATYSLPRAVAALPGGYAVADVLGRTIAVGTDVAERSHMVDAQRVPDWPLGGPEGVVWVQRTGRLYVSDAIRGRIVVFNLRR
jgi:hypothetical protein